VKSQEERRVPVQEEGRAKGQNNRTRAKGKAKKAKIVEQRAEGDLQRGRSRE
jgi:hypothetical protein